MLNRTLDDMERANSTTFHKKYRGLFVNGTMATHARHAETFQNLNLHQKMHLQWFTNSGYSTLSPRWFPNALSSTSAHRLLEQEFSQNEKSAALS